MPRSKKDALTCWSLVRSAARGEGDARSDFTRTYAQIIRGFLESRWQGRKPLADVDDALQDVFLECFKPNGALARAQQGNGDFRAFLYAVTRNVARRFEERAVVRQRLRPADTAWLASIAADEPGQVTLFERSWATVLIDEARDLYRDRAAAQGDASRRRSELLERRFGDDEAILDIARDWGVPAQDVHNAYRKARQEFYACLREVVAFHSPSATDVDGECRSLLAALG